MIEVSANQLAFPVMAGFYSDRPVTRHERRNGKIYEVHTLDALEAMRIISQDCVQVFDGKTLSVDHYESLRQCEVYASDFLKPEMHEALKRQVFSIVANGSGVVLVAQCLMVECKSAICAMAMAAELLLPKQKKLAVSMTEARYSEEYAKTLIAPSALLRVAAMNGTSYRLEPHFDTDMKRLEYGDVSILCDTATCAIVVYALMNGEDLNQ